MTWLVESFDVQNDKLLAAPDLGTLAARAVERLIEERSEVLEPYQIRVIAPLFDIDPDDWERVVESSTGGGVFESDWLSTAVVHLVGKVVDQPPEDLVGLIWPIPWEVSQGLLDRFSAGVRVPEGEVYIGFFGPPREASGA